MKFSILFEQIILLVIIFKSTECDLNKNRTFISLENPIPCIRRFNSTHQVGCGKLNYGSYNGIVYAVRDNKEYNRLYKIDSLGSFKLVVVTIPKYFISVVEYYKQNQQKINGIVLVSNENFLKSLNQTQERLNLFNYSDDSSSPNNKFSLYNLNSEAYSPFDWNTAGKGYMFENFEIPFYVIYDENESKEPFNNCYEKFNRKIFELADLNQFRIQSGDLLCGMELGLSMSGSVSSKVCARRSNIMHTLESNSFCDPLGGSNYLSFLTQKPSNQNPILILSAKLDTFTLYEYYTPGANEPISSLIGLFGIVELLAKYRNDFDLANILVVLFDNEAFDYGGSSRFVNDLVINEFPSIKLFNEQDFVLSKENITTFIELNQLGSIGLDDQNLLYVHKDPISYIANPKIKSLIDDLIQRLKKYSSDLITPIKNINQQLPPSSIHSFLKNNLSIGSISIADHEKEYKNKYYHSVFDTPDNLNITFPDNMTELEAENYTTKFSSTLQKLSTYIAQTIYSISSSNKVDLQEQVDIKTLNKLVYCFYRNSSCDFFRSILTDSQWSTYLKLLDSNLPKGKLSFYTGVNDNSISGKWISHMLLRYFSRNLDIQSFNSSDCKIDSDLVKAYVKQNNVTLKNLNYVNNSLCLASSIYSVSSVSPAFRNFDDGILINTEKYSAWSESSWNGVNIQMKMFMFTSTNVSALTLSLGLVSTILAVILTWIVNKYSPKWFNVVNNEQVTEFFE